MQIGFNAPTGGPLGTGRNLTALAQGAEALGFHYATFSDHVVIPADINAKYPYTDTGEFPTGSRGERHEQLTQLAFVAGRTSRLRLVTSVMVVPHRPAVLAAKVLATIDVLSEGRLTLGIGAGWLQEEFEALATAPFAERGAVTDEYLDAFKVLWTEALPSFHGTHVNFEPVSFEPKPAQPGGPPIWVGGESGPALRRTARIGDAWYPIGTNPQFPLDSLALYQAGVARLRKLVTAAGRDPAKVGLAYRCQKFGPEVAPRAGDGQRKLFSGSAAEIAGDLRDLGASGLGHLDLNFPGSTVEECLGAMKRFQDDILGKV